MVDEIDPADAIIEKPEKPASLVLKFFRSSPWRVIAQLAKASALASLIIAALNSSSLKRLNLEQSAASQLRYVLSDPSVIAAREKLFKTFVVSASRDPQMWDFSRKMGDEEFSALNSQLNSLEVTAGLVNEGVVDAFTICRTLAQRIFFWTTATVLATPSDDLVPYKIAFVPLSPALFDKNEYPELRTLSHKWFHNGSFFKSKNLQTTTNFEEACEAVAPRLTFLSTLTLH